MRPNGSSKTSTYSRRCLYFHTDSSNSTCKRDLVPKVHRLLRSCDLGHLTKIKEGIDDAASPAQVAVISRGNAEAARAVAIEVCREKALQGLLTP